MSLLNKMKSATGIGLSASEQYNRAFEKGVLLGPSKFSDASKIFQETAGKAQQQGDAQLAARAAANAQLYGYLASGNATHLQALQQVLPNLQEIEQIGSRAEYMPTAKLQPEVNARLLEAQVAASHPDEHATLAGIHRAASGEFKKFFTDPLVTYAFRPESEHNQSAQERFFLHEGLAQWHDAMHVAPTNPSTAAEHMAKALNAFRQCGNQGRSQSAERDLQGFRTRRSCWMCHREYEGAQVHYNEHDAVIAPYVLEVIKRLNQDARSVDTSRRKLILCEPCASSINGLAGKMAEKHIAVLRAEYDHRMAEIGAALTQLTNRIGRLENSGWGR